MRHKPSSRFGTKAKRSARHHVVYKCDVEHNQDDVRPRLRKRRRVNVSNSSTGRTGAQRQTHQFGADRSQRTGSPSRHLKRRNRPSIPSPPSPQGPASEEETAKAHAAKFEEWPLGNAVFKRVALDGITTFQLQFTWDPCPVKYSVA